MWIFLIISSKMWEKRNGLNKKFIIKGEIEWKINGKFIVWLCEN